MKTIARIKERIDYYLVINDLKQERNTNLAIGSGYDTDLARRNLKKWKALLCRSH